MDDIKGASGRPLIMGIVNVTPDSFSDGGQFFDPQAAVAHGLKLVEDGAHILDIGGESTRPGAEEVLVEEEIARVLPVLQGLKVKTAAPLSIDTRKPEVMRAAAEAGAALINDVSALTFAPDSLETAATLALPVVLTHAQGAPKTMQEAPRYGDVVAEVFAFLQDRKAAAEAAGVAPGDIILDPGIGFGKTLEHNLTLLARLDALSALGSPVLLGASRKRFIAALDEGAQKTSA